MINIITRTHRENYFKVLEQSLKEQTYKDYNWVVGSDLEECKYYNAIKLTKEPLKPIAIPQGYYYAPHNLYMNYLQEFVNEGFMMALDDDDMFTSSKSLERIVNQIDNENQLLVWKVQITPKWTVPCKSFGHHIQAGDFSGIGMCWHSSYKPDWGNLSFGDYRAATQLLKMGLKIKWIDLVLTQTQGGPHNGR